MAHNVSGRRFFSGDNMTYMTYKIRAMIRAWLDLAKLTPWNSNANCPMMTG